MIPAWRIPPPRRDRSARASSITATRPAQQRADRRAEPLRQAEHRGVGPRRELATAPRRSRSPRSRCARRRSAPRTRASRATVVTVRSSATRHGRPHAGMCVFSSEHRGDLGQVVRGAGRGARDVVGVEDAVGVGQRPELHARVAGRGRVLVAVHVGALAAQHLGAGAAEHAQRELVRHGARRHVERRFLAQQPGGQRLEPADGRVLAVGVVTDLGVGHRAPHLGGGRRDRVGPQVDGAVTRAHVNPSAA